MIQQLLSEIGLSDKEAKMYIVLLRFGMQSTSFLAGKANLNRGTAFVILHSLLKKGLVMKSVNSKIQFFKALPPEHLVSYLEHKEQELQLKREKIIESLDQFKTLQNPSTPKPVMEFFEGREGARAVLEDTLASKDKTLKAFLSIKDVAEFVGPEYFDRYTTKRVQKGYTLNVIRTLAKDKEALAKDKYAKRYMTSNKEKREVRYVSENLGFPVTIYIYDNKLAVISSVDENFALLIQSREMADMQKKIFDMLWSSLKKAEPIGQGL